MQLAAVALCAAIAVALVAGAKVEAGPSRADDTYGELPRDLVVVRYKGSYRSAWANAASDWHHDVMLTWDARTVYDVEVDENGGYTLSQRSATLEAGGSIVSRFDPPNAAESCSGTLSLRDGFDPTAVPLASASIRSDGGSVNAGARAPIDGTVMQSTGRTDSRCEVRESGHVLGPAGGTPQDQSDWLGTFVDFPSTGSGIARLRRRLHERGRAHAPGRRRDAQVRAGGRRARGTGPDADRDGRAGSSPAAASPPPRRPRCPTRSRRASASRPARARSCGATTTSSATSSVRSTSTLRARFASCPLVHRASAAARRPLALGTKRLDMRAGRVVRVKVKLARAVRRALKRKKAHVRATVTLRDDSANQASKSFGFTLKHRPKKRGRQQPR